MILSRYQDIILLLVVALVSFLLITLKLHWSNVSLVMFGFIWEYARQHQKLEERSQDHKYRFSFIRLFYFINKKVNKIPGLVYLTPTLIIVVIASLTRSDVAWITPLIGTLVGIVFYQVKKRI